MRCLSIYRPDTENTGPLDPEHMARMGKLVQDLTKAGVLLSTAGLAPGGKGARVRIKAGAIKVTDGPFTEAKELIAGIAVVKVPSLAAAIDHASQFLPIAGDGETEIRQMFDGNPDAPTRFLMMYRPDRNPETAGPPSKEHLTAMNKLCHDAMQAGTLLASEGLKPGSQGALVRLSRGKVTVIDGPFSEAKELVGGYAILQVKSVAEAIEHARPFLAIAGDGITEVRPLYEASDFAG